MAFSKSQKRAAIPLAIVGGIALTLRIIVAFQDHAGELSLSGDEGLSYLTMTSTNMLAIIAFLFSSLGEALGYFTMVTNTFAAFYFIYIALGINWQTDFLKRMNVLSAFIVFLSMASIIYHVLLSAAWQPTGTRWIISFVYHTLMPVLVLTYWFRFNEIEKIGARQLLFWYFLTVFYLTYVFIRGAIVNAYPYPFLNVSEIGISQLALNILGLTLFFFVLTGAYYLLGKYVIRFRRQTPD